MSGETYSSIVEQHLITKDNYRGYIQQASNYQIDSLNFNAIVQVPEFNEDKILSEKQKEKLIEKYRYAVCDLMPKEDKYSFKGLLLGVISFDKMKPVFTETTSYSFVKPKGSKINGYCIKNVRFTTLSDAKKYAKSMFMRTGQSINISKCYVDKYDRQVGAKPVIRVNGELVGTMKTKPKNTPKSYVVIPRYLYAIEFTLVDAEYEWM